MRSYEIRALASESASTSSLNWGLARDLGILRMSARKPMSAALSKAMSASMLRFEWPIVKKGSFIWPWAVRPEYRLYGHPMRAWPAADG
jgi:hypothetical protein